MADRRRTHVSRQRQDGVSTTLTRAVDALLPGPGSALDRASNRAHSRLRWLAGRPAARPVTQLLRGNDWLGHPAHPVLVMVPIGAWSVAGVYDARAALSADPRADAVADAALGVGLLTAAAAVVTGLAQFLDTGGAVRREAAAHAALNALAAGLFTGSWQARRSGHRRAGRRLSAAALGLVGVSGYLGDDLAYRHGVGVSGHGRSPR